MSLVSKLLHLFKRNENQNSASSISQRGLDASNSVLRVDMDIYFEAVNNIYDSKSNPTGVFPLNMAENKLTWNILRDKIKTIHSETQIPDWVAGYTSGRGSLSFREAVAHFFSNHLTKCPINPENLIFSAGATSVIELTSTVLGNPEDVVGIPAPCYPVYKQDIGNLAQLERFNIITHHNISELTGTPFLEVSNLEKAKKSIENAGKKFRILILTTPDNPTGRMYSYDQLLNITDWCIKNEVHLIVNEIYGLSLIDTNHPDIKEDYPTDIKFISFAQIMSQKKSDYLHLWYAFSKDFGISGFRIGCVYSYNELFLKAYENLNYPRLVSNHTQWTLEMILKDNDFVTSYISTNQKLLTEAYIVVRNTMKKLEIEYIPSRGSLFIWVDLSEFLAENTQESENEFWMEFYERTKILLTPGEGFGHTKKGLFRIVYPYFSKEDLEVAMNRFSQYVYTKRQQKD